MRGLVVAAVLLAATAPGCDDSQGARARLSAAALTDRADGRSAWVRITPEGLEAVPEALRGVLAAAPVEVPIPPRREGAFTVCTGGSCSVRLSLARLSLSPRASGELGLSAGVAARGGPIGVRYEERWACAFTGRAECRVDLDTERVAPPVIGASAIVVPALDAASGLGTLALRDPSVTSGIDGGDLTIGGANACGQVWCSVGNLLGAQRWIADEANRALVREIRREAEALTCLRCRGGSDCPGGAACIEGVCRQGAGDACVPVPLAAAARLESRDGRGRAALAVALGDAVEVRRGGLDAALRIAATVERPHRCAAAVEAPAHRALPQEVLQGPERGVHVRLAVAESAIDRALWAAHAAGVGCIDVGSREVPELDAAMLAIVLPSSLRLSRLGLGDPGLVVRPLAPPTAKVEADGSVTVRSSAIRLDVEAVVDGRRLRLASGTLRASASARVLALGGTLSLVIPPDSVIVEVIDLWSAPVLGAGRAELAETYDALASIAQGTVPERIPLEVPIPVSLEPVRTAAWAREGTRALVVDLRVGARR